MKPSKRLVVNFDGASQDGLDLRMDGAASNWVEGTVQEKLVKKLCSLPDLVKALAKKNELRRNMGPFTSKGYTY